MNYQETVDYLYNQLPLYQRTGGAAYKANLENTYKLDKHFESPHKKYKTVHVGGTNGKGSVCHMLASVLQNAGYVVGLHTSPHLIDFRERIKINGKLIPEEYIVKFVMKNMAFFRNTQPSFFEMSVFMAFDYFASKKVDIAIIEVGLGGRLDSTNIITPLFSVITNIGFDHMDFLGNSLDKIAYEKAGIIKDSVPVIIGESSSQINSVFLKTAEDKSSPIVFADQIYSIDYGFYSSDEKQIFNVEKEKQIFYNGLKTDLLGSCQGKNVVTALACIDLLRENGLGIDNMDIYNGLERVISNTGLNGRWQLMDYNPRIVCDTAHNQEGFKSVISQLENTPYSRLHLILGFVKDKNIDEFLKVFPKDASYYFTKADIPRALDERIILKKSKKYNLKGKSYYTVREAYNAARSSAHENDMIFIGGSTYIVADYLKFEKG